MMRDRLLIDVDGVVADLMGGFSLWMKERHGEVLRKEDITRFNIPTSPALAEIHSRVNLNGALDEFLALPAVYDRYVQPIPGAVEAIKELQELVDPIFVTATLRNSPQSYVSKFVWCERHFGEVPMIAAPSRAKDAVRGRWGTDDRWDTCERWREQGVRPLLFGQPWNEAPPEALRHDWPSIVRHVRDDMDRWPG